MYYDIENNADLWEEEQKMLEELRKEERSAEDQWQSTLRILVEDW